MTKKIAAYIKEESQYWLERIKKAPVFGAGVLLLALLGMAVLGLGPYAGLDGSGPAGVTPGAAGFIRWHFYANSDLPEDQLLKLELKDQIMERAAYALAEVETARECREALSGLLPELAAEGQALLEAWGCAQELSVYYGPRYFSERELDEKVLPEGVYETVTFTLGEGRGANWWGLLFPPLAPGKEVLFYEPEQAEPTRQAEALRERNGAGGSSAAADGRPGAGRGDYGATGGTAGGTAGDGAAGGTAGAGLRNNPTGRAAAGSGGVSEGRVPVVCKLKILELFRQ